MKSSLLFMLLLVDPRASPGTPAALPKTDRQPQPIVCIRGDLWSSDARAARRA